MGAIRVSDILSFATKSITKKIRGPLGGTHVEEYIKVQLTAHISLSGLTVLKILYRLFLTHKRNKSQNCAICVL